MSNTVQVDYWNGAAGARWAEARDRIDASLAAITEVTFAHAAPRAGERVLDIGCGCGTTTFALRGLVGTSGAACGIDVSAPMLDVARLRGANSDVTFIEADASTYRFTFTFDLVFSRFGVMFFTDPVGAFANIRTAITPGGRLAFVCWRSIAENPWATAPVAAAAGLVPDEPASDPLAPGPFAFADRARLEDVLTRGGLRDIAVRPLDSTVLLGSTIDEAAAYAMMIGPLARRAAGLDDDTLREIRTRVATELAKHTTPAGVALPAGTWMVSARA